MFSGQFFAILSAALFGVSPVLCKLIIGDMSPALLAGLLYLGSGIGLSLVSAGLGKGIVQELRELSHPHRRKLLGAVLAGGVVAPLCLAYGIKYGNASEVTLLLNLETVATTLIAWLVFKEYIGTHVWIGKVLIVLAASLIVLKSEGDPAFSYSSVMVVLACIFWGIDNNLTRDVEELSATALATVKGFGAGLFNTALALALGTGAVSNTQAGGALMIGAFSYGVSLVLFVEALRRIGSARTSTFFAIGPFIGTLSSLLILGERPPALYWFAAILMLAGVVILYWETHGHPHCHETVAHRHKHIHDEHHRHDHEEGDGAEPHDHFHMHEPLCHYHVHWPDIHHRHSH